MKTKTHTSKQLIELQAQGTLRKPQYYTWVSLLGTFRSLINDNMIFINFYIYETPSILVEIIVLGSWIPNFFYII